MVSRPRGIRTACPWKPLDLGRSSRCRSNRDRVNDAVKFREESRPFAPSVLEEAGPSYFERSNTTPFMTLTFQVRAEKKEDIAAAVHIDGSSRVQSVTREQNQRYYDLIKAFAAKTGVPAVLNTSFNLKGEESSIRRSTRSGTLYTSGLDALFLDRYLITKTLPEKDMTANTSSTNMPSRKDGSEWRVC